LRPGLVPSILDGQRAGDTGVSGGIYPSKRSRDDPKYNLLGIFYADGMIGIYR